MAMCALVFQNVVPVVAANLAFDPAKVQHRQAERAEREMDGRTGRERERERERERGGRGERQTERRGERQSCRLSRSRALIDLTGAE